MSCLAQNIFKINNKKILILISIFLIPSITTFANLNKNSTNTKYTILANTIQNNYLVQEQLEKNCNKSEILEFFSYSCPACHKIEPEVNNPFAVKLKTEKPN